MELISLHLYKPTILIILLLVNVVILKQTKATPTPVISSCDKRAGDYAQDSLYQKNLNVLLTHLTTHAVNASYYSSDYGISPNRVYGRYYCRADIKLEFCSECVQAAAQKIVGEKDCPTQMKAATFYEECTLDYSNQPLVFIDGSEVGGHWYSTVKFWNQDQSAKLVHETMTSLMKIAADGNGSHQYFATKEADLSSGQTLYNLVQCTPNVTSTDCFTCLQSSLSDFREINELKTEWAMYFVESCQIRYDVSLFYDSSLVLSPPPPAPYAVPNVHHSPPHHPTSDSSPIGKNIVLRIAAAAGSLLLLVYVCIL